MQPDTVLSRDAGVEAATGIAPVVAGYSRRAFSPGFWMAAAFLISISLVAVLADVLPLQDPLAPNPAAAKTPPSAEYWLGTDAIGRDLLSRVIHGARISLVVAIASAVIAGIIGGIVGTMAGFFRGWRETWLMAAMDVMLAFPALVLALALTVFLGASLRNIIITIGVLGVPIVARIARAQTLSYSQREFVLAARAMGSKSGRIILREITPNVFPSVLAFSLVLAAVAIIIEGSLSFLGLGVPPPAPAWGSIIASGQPYLATASHITLLPSLVMFLTVLSFNTVGERLRSKYDEGGEM